MERSGRKGVSGQGVLGMPGRLTDPGRGVELGCGYEAASKFRSLGHTAPILVTWQPAK